MFVEELVDVLESVFHFYETAAKFTAERPMASLSQRFFEVLEML